MKKTRHLGHGANLVAGDQLEAALGEEALGLLPFLPRGRKASFPQVLLKLAIDGDHHPIQAQSLCNAFLANKGDVHCPPPLILASRENHDYFKCSKINNDKLGMES